MYEVHILFSANATGHREPDLSAIRWNGLFGALFLLCDCKSSFEALRPKHRELI